MLLVSVDSRSHDRVSGDLEGLFPRDVSIEGERGRRMRRGTS